MVAKSYYSETVDTGDPGLWMLPHGNLMLILMILFLVLTATIIFSPLEYMVAITGYAREMAKGEEKNRIQYSLEELNLAVNLNRKLKGQTKGLIVTRNEIRLILSSPILFDSGKAELKPEAHEVLDKINSQIESIKNPVVVEGHTDNVPVGATSDFESNWDLSAARAFSVIKYFIDKKEEESPYGIEKYAARFSAFGCAYWKPYDKKPVEVSNVTEEGRAKNRRIEIIILRRKS